MPSKQPPPWESASAVLSEDGVYRYELWRTLTSNLLGSKGTVAFCMLNPSTADANTDDPTVRRCVRYAQRWGYAKLAIVNLYPYRAAKPADLHAWLREERQANWVGLQDAIAANYTHVGYVADRADMLVAAWGQHGHGAPVASFLLDRYPLHALALNKNGSPAHPLYQPAHAQPRQLVRATNWVLV